MLLSVQALLYFLLCAQDTAAASQLSGISLYSRAVNNSFNLNATLLTFLTDLSKAKTCDDCSNIFRLLQNVSRLGDEPLSELLVAECIALGEDSADVCQGLESREAPILAEAWRNMMIPSRTSNILCNVLLGLCDLPAVLPYNVTFAKPKPKSTGRHRWHGNTKNSTRTPLKIVHISDIHIDRSYEVGSSYNCTEPTCCGTFNNPAYAPNVTQYPAGPFGEYTCDSPVSLEESMYQAIDELVPDRAFTVFTGDLVSLEWLTTQDSVTADINDVYTRIQKLGLVYPAVGNHDTNPVNSFPLDSSNVTAYNNDTSWQWLYNTFSADWARWISRSFATVRNNHGSYSTVYPGSNLRIISVNTMFWMKVNFWLYTPTMARDPSGVLAWLANELQSAEDAGQKAFIIGHMPLGRTDALYDYSAYFDQVVQRYSHVITAQFFGHTHRDQWEIAYTNYTDQTAQSADSITYITSSMTPTSGNPSFRVYDVDPDTYQVLDYTVYLTNLSDPGYQTNPNWVPYYSAKEAYGSLFSPPYTDPSAPLTPTFWHNVTDLFEHNDTAFQQYYDRKQRGWEYVFCDAACKSAEICQLRSAQSQYGCFDTSVSSVTKRGERLQRSVSSGRHSDSECEGSTVIKILEGLMGRTR